MSTENKDMPKEFQQWITENSEKPMGGNYAWHRGAIAAYRHLSPSSETEIRRSTIDRLYQSILASGQPFPGELRDIFHKAMNLLGASSEPAKESRPDEQWNRESARAAAKEAYKSFAGLPSEFDDWFDNAFPPSPQPEPSEESRPDDFLEWLDGNIEFCEPRAKGEEIQNGTSGNYWTGQINLLRQVREKYLSLHARPKPEPSEKDIPMPSDEWFEERRKEIIEKVRLNGRQDDSPSVKPEREDNWISIKESPEEYRQVLLWFEGLKTIAIGYLINGSWADENKNLLWCEPDHWAAMPTPPSHPSSAPPAVQQEDGEVPEEIAKWIESIHDGRWGFRPGAVAMYHKTQQEIAQLNEYRKEGKRYSEMLEEKITNLHKAISALHQEKEDYLKALDRILHDPNKHPSIGRYCSEILSKYTPQNPTNE